MVTLTTLSSASRNRSTFNIFGKLKTLFNFEKLSLASLFRRIWAPATSKPLTWDMHKLSLPPSHLPKMTPREECFLNETKKKQIEPVAITSERSSMPSTSKPLTWDMQELSLLPSHLPQMTPREGFLNEMKKKQIEPVAITPKGRNLQLSLTLQALKYAKKETYASGDLELQDLIDKNIRARGTWSSQFGDFVVTSVAQILRENGIDLIIQPENGQGTHLYNVGKDGNLQGSDIDTNNDAVMNYARSNSVVLRRVRLISEEEKSALKKDKKRLPSPNHFEVGQLGSSWDKNSLIPGDGDCLFHALYRSPNLSSSFKENVIHHCLTNDECIAEYNKSAGKFLGEPDENLFIVGLRNLVGNKIKLIPNIRNFLESEN
jgi:hypothetical protein